MNSTKIRQDLNTPVFQRALFRLEKKEQNAVLNSFRKLSEMTWSDLYQDSGLHWELIHSRSGSDRIYSFRITKKNRGLAVRDGDWLRILSIYPDHDSAYK